MAEAVNNVAVRLRAGGDADYARTLTAQLAAHQLELRLDAKGLTLSDGALELRGDFTHMLSRIRPGVVQRELVVRAAKVKKAPARRPLAVDATAGLGEDSLLLAAAGFQVVLFEHNPVIAALLEDALRRAALVPELADVIARMTLVEGDSVAALEAMAHGEKIPFDSSAPESAKSRESAASLPPASALTEPLAPDVVLLDPMFPERRKSASVKKKLQLLQQLECPCDDESTLLNAAIAAHPRKVVIKRPPKGPYLAGVKPSYSLTGKAVRYDCIALPEREVSFATRASIEDAARQRQQR